MKTTNSNTQSKNLIEPNEPQSKSTQLKMIQQLVKNKFLTRQNKLKVLLSIRKSDEPSDE
jgi:hypothetical protein